MFFPKKKMADIILQQRKEQNKNTLYILKKKMADTIFCNREKSKKTLYVFPKRKWQTIFCNKEQKKNTSCFLKKKMADNILPRVNIAEKLQLSCFPY